MAVKVRQNTLNELVPICQIQLTICHISSEGRAPTNLGEEVLGSMPRCDNTAQATKAINSSLISFAQP